MIRSRIPRPLILLLTLAALLALSAGCASTSSGGGGDMMEKPDYRDEVGENGLLTPRAILARFVEATGGEEALMAHDSATIRGKMEMPAMGMSGDMVIYQAKPNRMVMEAELSGMGTMNSGYNGEIGWSDNPMQGAQLLDGKMLSQTKRQGEFLAQLRYDELYPTQETLELTDYAGESAYKVRLVDTDGTETLQYFSEATSLLIGQEGTQASPMGDIDVKVTFKDYTDFGGIKSPATTVLEMMGMEIRQVVEEVTYDNVEDSAFEPPDSVKGLLN